MVFQKIFLFRQTLIRKRLQLPEMRPAIFVFAFQLVITTLSKQTTDGHMHQVLFLLFGELGTTLTEFLYADQE